MARVFPWSIPTVTLIAAAAVVTGMVVTGMVVTAPDVSGQGIFRTAQRMTPGRFIEAPRSIQQQLREAERALEDERYSEAVVRLGDLLASEADDIEDVDLFGQDFFLDVDDARAAGVPITRSLFRTAREMIGKLPREALETYELRYGPLARKLLLQAAAARDWEMLRTVRRKYFHTMAGYEASLLLAQHEMFGGHPLAASMLLDDVVTASRAVQHLGRSVLLFHASACKLAGRELPSLDAVSDSAGSLEVGGDVTDWPRESDLPEWLEARFGSLNEIAGGQIADYPLFGARSNRNGSASGQMPLTNFRWELDTTASPRQEQTVRKAAEELTTSGKLPPPSWIPLRVGDQLLMRTTELLVGVDYRTGKRVWTYPWQTGLDEVESSDSVLDGLPGETDPSDLLSQRVWNDVPYGQMTSDGERVYVLDDLGEVELASYNPMLNLRGTRPADTGTNTLVALDLATEGKLRWRLGAGSNQASTLADAFFLGPPLPLDGRLYVMVEIAGDINLCCLDPNTGDELWRQQLVAVESGGIDRDPIRRVAGAMPTFHEGVLICPTGAGAIVAIDLGDRTLRWGVNYDRNTEMMRSINSGRGRGIEVKQLMQRWFTGTAVASGNAVLVTPIETDRLFGFDLLTGASLFAQKNRVHMRYLAGIRGDRFFVVSSNQVRAFDLHSGTSIWTTPRDMLTVGQQIAGYGMFGEGEFFVPTTANQIISVSLEDGTVTQRRITRYPLGNLVAVDGEVIIQGPTKLSVAFGEATLEPLVNRMLEKNPNDFDALVRKAELQIQHGQRDEALELLRRAREMQPDNDEVRMLSVAAMLGTLRENLDKDHPLAEGLSQLIDRPSQRVELLALRVRSALLRKQREQAFRFLLALSELVISERSAEASAGQVVNDASRQCTLDAWIAARVVELADGASKAELELINEEMQEALALKVDSSTSLLKRVVRHFGVLDGIEAVRGELAQRMLDDNAYLELERLALGTQIPSVAGLATLSPTRSLMLAEAYASGRMPSDAIEVLDQLESREAPVDAGEIRDRVREIREMAASQITTFDWPQTANLKWDSRQTSSRQMPLTRKIYATNILAGKEFADWRLMRDGTSPLAIRDPNGTPRRITLERRRTEDVDKESQICGGFMVVMMREGLVGLDMHQLVSEDGEAMLWRRDLGGDSNPVATRRSASTPFGDNIVRYNISSSVPSNVPPEFKLGPIMGDRVLVLQGGDLLAIDLFNGETIWRNSAAPKSGSVISDGKRVAVVSPSTDEVVLFDLVDGRTLEIREWKHGTVWAAAESNVLAFQQTKDRRKYDVRVANPFTGEVLLQKTTFSANRSSSTPEAPSAYGRIIAGRYLVMMDNEGKSLIWDIRDGVELGTPQLPPYPDLQGLQATLMDGQMLLLPKRRVERAPPQTRQLHTTDGISHTTTHGVHAVSMEDGSLRWSQQFEQPWGCTVTQPARSPILLLSRSPFVYTAASRRKWLDVLALDVRDGSVMKLYEERPVSNASNDLETKLTVQPLHSRVIVQIGTSELLTYIFVEPEAEQEPAAAP